MNKIIDPRTGEPFAPEKTLLTTRQTEASVYSVRTPTPGYSIAINITPERCARALREAESFYIEPFMVLAEEIEERDTHYSSVLRTRKLKAANLPMTVTPGGEDEKSLMLAEEVRKLMNRPFIKMMKMDLLDGLGKGFAVCELMYRTSKSHWDIVSAPWVDPRFFEFDQETRQE
ncbi:phage portal protein family protein, partial [Vibrio scophthalmi]